MSLRVWLPFDGDIVNNGVNSNITFTKINENPTFENNGKIGKCAHFNGGYIESTNVDFSDFDKTCVSISCWVKDMVTAGAWHRIGGINAHTFIHLDVSTDGTVRCFVSKNGTKTNFEAVKSTTAITDKKWHHVCGVVSETKIKIYIDGVLEKTTNRTVVYNPATYNLRVGSIKEGNNFNGYINDFRFYDHALSAKEVKEISKGLVLHYKLSNGYGNKNLIIEGNKASFWVAENCTRTQETDNMFPEHIKIVTTTANKRIYRETTNVWTTLGDYTVSFYAKTDTEGMKVNMSRSIADFSKNFTLTNEWRRYVGHITTTATADAGTLSFRLINAGTVYLANVKLELGDSDTPYCPNSSDKSYSVLGYNDITIYDESGYGRNGVFWHKTKLDSPTFNSSSPIGLNCLKLTNTEQQCISRVLTPLNKESTNFSFCFWFKANNLNATHTIYTARTVVGGGIAIFASNANRIRFDDGENSADQFIFTNYTYDTNWHYYVITRDDTSKKLYVDGELKQTANKVGTLNNIGVYGSIGASDSSNNGYGDNNWTNGSLADFRIYTTTLSEEDVKEMYNVRVSIDNYGNVLGREYIEKEDSEKSNFEKKYIINSSKFQEVNESSIPKTIRYIKDIIERGSTVNDSAHWVEIEVYDKENNNIALNKKVSVCSSYNSNPTTFGNNARITDGDKTSGNYRDGGKTSSLIPYVIVDLGEEYEINKLVIYHYYQDKRTYLGNKTLVSNDGKNWIKVFDSDIDGEYVETSSGHTINLTDEVLEEGYKEFTKKFKIYKDGTLQSNQIIEI